MVMRDLIKPDALLWLVVFQQLWLVHFDPCCFTQWFSPSAVRCRMAFLLLCFLIVGIHASGISIPLSLLMLLGWNPIWLLLWLCAWPLPLHAWDKWKIFIVIIYMVSQILTNVKEITLVTWMLPARTPTDPLCVNASPDLMEMVKTAQVNLIFLVQYLEYSRSNLWDGHCQPFY